MQEKTFVQFLQRKSIPLQKIDNASAKDCQLAFFAQKDYFCTSQKNILLCKGSMNLYLEAFSIFFKIGAFTIGGGYAMVPLIENEIVTKRNWIAKEDFIDLLAIAQSSPGILAVNISIFIGYRLKGIPGSIITALGTVLPSFLIILAIALFFHNFKDNAVVERIFKGIRPAVVALIAAPTFSMARSAKINRHNVWIPVVSALLIWLLGFSPIWIIITAGLGGYLYGRWNTNKQKTDAKS